MIFSKKEIFRKVIVLDDISDETILSSISYRNCMSDTGN